MSSPPQDLIGRTLAGRYRLGSLLGVGGMGAVYLGFDERLRREVAVKVLNPALATDATAVARFVREAHASAALAHPCVVTVFDTGVDEGTAYLVMERLQGESLADRMRRGPLAPDAAVRIGARILEGLEAAHAIGIVHRDIKPANVLLCEPDDAPKLLDFGIAAVRALSPEDPRLTETGTGMGTPLYVAPEQLRGEEPDPRADLYSVAAVLYEAVSGRPVFVARSVAEAYAKKLTETPPSLASANVTLPTALAAAIERGLMVDPGARFARAPEFRSALLSAAGIPEAALTPLKPVTPTGLETPPAAAVDPVAETRAATPGTPIAVASQRPRRTRTLPIVVAVALAAILLGGGAVVLAGFFRDEPDPVALPPPPLEPPRVGLRTLDQFHDARGSKRSLLAAPAGWEAASADFARALEQPGAPPHWNAAKRFCDGRAKALQGDLEGAEADLRAAVQLEETWATVHVGLAGALTLTGEVDAALAAARRAQQLEPDWWLPVATVGSVYATADRLDDAIQEFRRALTLAPEEPAVLGGLALALHASRMDAEAERYASMALERDPDSVGPRLLLAERALERGDGETALREATRAASVSPHGAAAQLVRADALALLGRDAEALQVYRHTLDLVDRTRQVGLPPDRLAQVREHLARSEIPPPRTQVGGESLAGRTPPAPAATQRAPLPERTRRSRAGGGRPGRTRDVLDGLDE